MAPRHACFMIDIHAHILPGVDDGPSTAEESIEMARLAAKDGIRTIVATPHSLNGMYFNGRDDILAACESFNHGLRKHQIPLVVLPGCESYLCPEILEELDKGRLMTLNDTGRYLVLEIPDSFIPQTIIHLINRLRSRSIIPILSHPERNLPIQRNVELLGELIAAGALSQITGSSLMGGFGRRALRCTKRIIERQMAHFVASDAHSLKGRPPVLHAVFEKLTSIVGEARAEKMMLEAPRAVVDGTTVNENFFLTY